MKPLAFDLFCGKGGWTAGLQAAGWRVIGFDIERWPEYPGLLVVQDVRTLDGSQFRHASLIVASPPCNEYSYRAMPWKRAKFLPPPDNTLFETCFRLQHEANEAAGKHIPMVLENVCGAQRWVGRAKWHFGSYYLWGDVPAIMPETVAPARKFNPDRVGHFTKNNGGSWFTVAHNTKSGHSRNPVNNFQEDGVKLRAPGHYRKPGSGKDWFDFGPAMYGSKTSARKAASAQIAMIPFQLARYIGEVYR